MGSKTPNRQAHVLTPTELELVDSLTAALLGKATADAALIIHRKEIGRLTTEINKLSFSEDGKMKPGLLRATVIWAEARAKLGASPAPTQVQLAQGT